MTPGKFLQVVFTNRNSLLILSAILGLTFPYGAPWTDSLVIPGLVVVMTLSMVDVTAKSFIPVRAIITPLALGAFMSYGVLTTLVLCLSSLFITNESFRIGFVVLAAVPPAVAVVPFTFLFKGDVPLSLFGMIGGYLAGLLLMPLITLVFIGPGLIDSKRLAIVMVQIIVIPVILSRIIQWIKAERLLLPIKGSIVNWCFFLLSYTIIALNQKILFESPRIVLPVLVITVITAIPLAWLIELSGKVLHIDHRRIVPLILLGTLKNFGIAGGIALALFDNHAAMPATVSSVFMVVYLIYLDLRFRKQSSSR